MTARPARSRRRATTTRSTRGAWSPLSWSWICFPYEAFEPLKTPFTTLKEIDGAWTVDEGAWKVDEGACEVRTQIGNDFPE